MNLENESLCARSLGNASRTNCPMFALNISKAPAIVKLDANDGILRGSFTFELVPPRPDFLLALSKDIVHFFVAV